jgi:plastocyanin
MRPSRTLHRRPSLVVALAIGAVALLGACGDDSDSEEGGGGGGGETSGAGTVEIESSRFAPEELTVDAGTSVEFVNLDGFDHTVTSDDGSALEFDSGALGQDESFTQAFDEAGSFDYFCQIHPTMRGTITVE